MQYINEEDGGHRNHKQNPLQLIKTTIFIHTLSQAGWNRFSSIYMLSHGFTPTQIGYINSLSKVSKAVAQPLWGIASDATNPCTALIVSTTFGTILLMMIRNVIDAGNVSSLTLWLAIRSAFTAASPALDALVLRLIENTSEGYGKQRLWGSVAWGVSSLCAGTLLDVFHEGALFWYTYFVNGVLLLFFLVFRTRILPEGNKPHKTKKKSPENYNGRVGTSTWTTLRDVSRGPQCFVLLHNFVYGAIMVLFDNILILQLERDFGLPRSVQGMFTLVNIFSSVPVYHYSHGLRERMGHMGMIQSSILVAFLRLLLMKVACSAFVSSGMRATWLLLIQLLHGYHKAANWTASVEMLDAMANKSIRSLMQFLLNLAYYTVGAGVGNLAWSYMYEKCGAQETYSYGLVLCMVDAFFVKLFCRYYRSNPSKSEAGFPLATK